MASRAAERYRQKGVDKTAQRMLAFLEEQGIEGATVLEIGGGVGDVQIELLKRGAARTTNLELSPGYDDEAVRLMREAGVEGRADRLLHDIAVDPASVEAADVVVLNRVVCCYPDFERLLSAGRPCTPTARLQLPTAKRAVTSPAGYAESDVQAATEGVSNVCAPAGTDARCRGGAWSSGRLHTSTGRLADRGIRASQPRELTQDSQRR